MTPAATTRELRVLVAVIAVFLFFTLLFNSVITPVLPGLGHELSLSTAQVGVLVGSYSVGSLLGILPGSVGAARWGVKPAACVAMLILGLSSIGFGLGSTYPALLIARFWLGFGDFMCGTAAFSWLLGAVPRERRGAMVGLVLGLSGAGTIVGPLLGAAASVDRGATFVGMGVATVALGLSALGLRSPPATRDSALRFRAALADAAARTGVTAAALIAVVLGALTVIVPLQLARLGAGAATIAATFTGSAVAGMLLTPLWGRWSDRRGEIRPASAASAIALAATVAVAWTGSVASVALLQALVLCAGWVSCTPLIALLARVCTERGVGEIVAVTLFNVALATAGIVGSAGAGTLDQAAGQRTVLLTCAALLALTVAVLTARRGDQPAPSRIR